MKNLYVSGYRSFELGIFQENDPKVLRIKKVLKNTLQQYLEEGLAWLIVGGNLGVEQWAVEVAAELKVDYPDFKISIIYPFAEFGSQWKENNQEKKARVESLADYVNATSKEVYQNPRQLKNHTQFLLDHTDGALLVYDEEFPTKLKFLMQAISSYQEKNPYTLQLITMDDLQNFEEF